MQVEVVYLPRDLKPGHLRDRIIVVLDVLRATTTMIAALHAGAKEIRIFSALDEARTAASGVADQKILCGEERCKKPLDFDLGNSPGEFTPERATGRTLFMSTTNGTRAILAAQSAPIIYVGALVNARATAEALIDARRNVTLLCAGTDGRISVEDVIGAGAIVNAAMLMGDITLANDEAVIAARADLAARDSYAAAFRSGSGARNLVAAGLEQDVDFAAQIDSLPLVAEVRKSDTGGISVFRCRQPV